MSAATPVVPANRPSPAAQAHYGPNLAIRKLTNYTMLGLCYAAAGLGILVLGLVLWFLASQGLHYINIALFTKLPDAVNTANGGMKQSILGTLTLLAVALAFGLPLGVLGGIYQVEAKGWFASSVRFMTDVLNGVPSIVIGIFVYAIYVYPLAQHISNKGGSGSAYSAWAGGLALGIMMIPTVMRTTEEMLRLVPFTMREASLGLGATRWRTMVSVVLPAAQGGIITGIMLALARIAGETAPLLFTILGNDLMQMTDIPMFGHRFFVPDPNAPIDALPLRIYNYATAPDTEQNHQAWAGALVLIVLILVMSIAARMATRSKVLEEK
jgi:phosphate transport system permease protein